MTLHNNANPWTFGISNGREKDRKTEQYRKKLLLRREKKRSKLPKKKKNDNNKRGKIFKIASYLVTNVRSGRV